MDVLSTARYLAQALEPQRLFLVHQGAGSIADALRELGFAVDEARAVDAIPSGVAAYSAALLFAPFPEEIDDWVEGLRGKTDTVVLLWLADAAQDVQDDFIQPAIRWAQALAQQGYFRDTCFDLSRLTPWAARFDRSPRAAANLAAEYERLIWETSRANQDLRMLNRALSGELAGFRDDARSISWRVFQRLRRVWRRVRAGR